MNSINAIKSVFKSNQYLNIVNQHVNSSKRLILSSSNINLLNNSIYKNNNYNNTTQTLPINTILYRPTINSYYSTSKLSDRFSDQLFKQFDITKRHYSSSGSNSNNSSSQSNSDNKNNDKKQNSDKEQDKKWKHYGNHLFLPVSKLIDKLKYILTRHKPMTSDQMFAIFSWLLFGTGSLVIVGTTTLVSLILWIVNTFEFSEWAANKVGKYLTNNTGISINFQHARGEWKTGYIRLENVTVSRRPRGDEHLSEIQLNIKQIDVKLSLLWMLEGKGMIQECLVSGVRGIIDRRTEGVYVLNNQIYPRKKKSPGDFEFEKLQVDDLLVTYYLPDTTRKPVSISIYHLDSNRFRKQWMLLDLLSCRNIVGKFDNQIFTLNIPQNPTNQHHHLISSASSKFQARELKIDGLNIDFLSKNATGPLGWIKEGTFDIHFQILLPNHEQQLLESEPNTIDYGVIPVDEDPMRNVHLQFKVQLNHLFSMAPLYTPELSYLSNALAHPIVAYMNSHSKHIELLFGFSMNMRQFNGAWTPSQAAFWDMMSAAVYKELSQKVQETKNVMTIKKVVTDLAYDIVHFIVPSIQHKHYYEQEHQKLEQFKKLQMQQLEETNLKASTVSQSTQDGQIEVRTNYSDTDLNQDLLKTTLKNSNLESPVVADIYSQLEISTTKETQDEDYSFNSNPQLLYYKELQLQKQIEQEQMRQRQNYNRNSNFNNTSNNSSNSSKKNNNSDDNDEDEDSNDQFGTVSANDESQNPLKFEPLQQQKPVVGSLQLL
ncbi:hypothetical protein DLAC_05844 [Tieghemostelium lacteum]|uniref:Uncharacterized protein n=1 Tax=Tieghemostelium lacteum TaxID=361077 RepID=A0A151ZH00_TIELA|nr:hypothetical protein DLAC_05844 [Tieghemostelium lacteum]|eukprot:KYQ93205.1 hypothetical protein DLAC_05844 [Tieghemostelium lacteum]